jgi:hypothetical protein
VDDFAVLWTNKLSMDHFITTLRQLYSVKINWEGSKYIGMDIAINRKKRHVTISMPGYIDKLLQSIRPNGIKAASTPATYCPPNFKNPGAQTATIDETPAASKEQKHELQSVIGILLYYSRTVDPSICTAVHALAWLYTSKCDN